MTRTLPAAAHSAGAPEPVCAVPAPDGDSQIGLRHGHPARSGLTGDRAHPMSPPSTPAATNPVQGHVDRRTAAAAPPHSRARRPVPIPAARPRTPAQPPAEEPAPLRIVVADDHTLVREGLVRVLERGGLDVVAVAGNADDLLFRAQMHVPDVVVTDIHMPSGHEEDGLQAALALHASLPQIGIIILSSYLEDEFAVTLVNTCRSGVGYLLKDRVAAPEVLLQAVRTVAAGGTVLDPDVVTLLVGQRRDADPLHALTSRERDVLALMAQGRSNAGIAAALCVTVPAVERHITGIFAKLALPHSAGDHRRVLAVLKYLQG